MRDLNTAKNFGSGAAWFADVLRHGERCPKHAGGRGGLGRKGL